MDENRILFVDLDGTLIREDLSNLAFFDFKKKTTETYFLFIYIYIQRKVLFKRENIEKFYCTNKKLTFNKSALNYVKDIKNRHRVVYLISGSHQILVDQIDQHLKIFFESFGTNNNFNMVGSNKIKFINEKLNINQFDYLGNSKKDLPIWEYTKKIIFTNVSASLREIIFPLT